MLSLWFSAVGQQRPAEPQRYGPEAQNSGEPDPSELWDGEEELVGRQFFDPTHPEFDPGWEPHLPTVVDADEVTGLMYDDLEPQHPLKGLYDVPDAPQPPTLARATSTTLSVEWFPPRDNGEAILGYSLWAAEAGLPLQPVYDPLRAGEHGEPERRSFVLRGLRPSTGYAVSVCAVNRRGNSDFSEQVRYATTAPAPTVSDAAPLTGPFAGGTRVTVRGGDFAFGSVFKCRLGDSVVQGTLVRPPPARLAAPPRAAAGAADALPSAEANGSAFAWPYFAPADDGAGEVVCYAPASPRRWTRLLNGEVFAASAQHVALGVSVDGVRYVDVHGGFHYHVMPASIEITPATGSLAGGTAVTVTGSFPLARRTRRGAPVGANAGNPAGSDAAAVEFPEAVCSFWGALVRATPLDSGRAADAALDAAVAAAAAAANYTNHSSSPSAPPAPPPRAPPQPELTIAISLWLVKNMLVSYL